MICGRIMKNQTEKLFWQELRADVPESLIVWRLFFPSTNYYVNCLNSTQAASKGARSKAKLRPGSREAKVLPPTAKRNRIPQAVAPKEAASSIAKTPTTTLPTEAMHASLCCPDFFLIGCDS